VFTLPPLLDFTTNPKGTHQMLVVYAGNKGLTWPAVDGWQISGSSGVDGRPTFQEGLRASLQRFCTMMALLYKVNTKILNSSCF